MGSNLPATNQSGFEQSYRAGLGAVLVQAARNDALRQRLTAAAVSLATGVAIALTGAPHEARADNSVSRTAIDTLGAVIGGALGSQFGQGNGRTAATVAGAAAGVWATESLQDNQQQRPSQQQRTNWSSGAPSLEPAISPNWQRQQSSQQSQNWQQQNWQEQPRGVRAVTSTSARLESGTAPMAPDRLARLADKEVAFLSSRDNYARTLYNYQQAQDDAVLDARGRGAQLQLRATAGATRVAEDQYQQAKEDFTNTVVYFGHRSYDVHQFAYSYSLAQRQVTAKDMSRNSVAQATHYRTADTESIDNTEKDSYYVKY